MAKLPLSALGQVTAETPAAPQGSSTGAGIFGLFVLVASCIAAGLLVFGAPGREPA